jgi:hypothetical protein
MKPELYKEFECSGTHYQSWFIKLDEAGISKRIGHQVFYSGLWETAYEATRDGKSVWYAPTYSGDDYVSDVIDCSGNSLLVRLYKNHNFEMLKVNFDTLLRPAVWTDPLYVNVPSSNSYGEVTVDGVKQFPGYARVLPPKSGVLANVGESRLMVIGGPQEGIKQPTWYRDMAASDMGDNGFIESYFFRLSDGYLVKERLYHCQGSPCDAPTDTTTWYRTHDGDSTYTVTNDPPKIIPQKILLFTKPGLALYDMAIGAHGFYGVGQGILVHGLPLALYNDQTLYYGSRQSMVQEVNDTYIVRYFVALSKNTLQYWQAVIQK